MSLQRTVALPAAAFKLTAATGPPVDPREPERPSRDATAAFAPSMQRARFVRKLQQDDSAGDPSEPAARARGSRVVLLPGTAQA